MSPCHPVYEGKAKVRHLPPGISGEDDDQKRPKLGIRIFGKPMPGYQTAACAAARLGISCTTLYRLCAQGKLPHIRVARDHSYRVFVREGAVPE